MTLKIRRLLFYSLTGLFLISGSVIIFYSNGLRLDLETLTINKLGAIFLKKMPDNAVVNIEKSNFHFESGILNSGLFIANLFPKTYHVKISKPGYRDWNKDLEVKPSLVTEVPPIILLPEKLEFKKIASWPKNPPAEILSADRSQSIFSPNSAIKKTDVKQTNLSPDQKFISIITKNGHLYLINEAAEQKLLAKNALKAEFSPDSEKLAFTTKNKEVVIYYLKESAKPNVVLNIGAPEETEIKWEGGSEYIFVLYPGSLYLLEGNDLPPINFQLISDNAQKFDYSEKEKRIYLLKDSVLYSLELK